MSQEKKYTVADALIAAKYRLGNRRYCCNALRKYELTDKITLDELNKIADQIVEDTNFYG